MDYNDITNVGVTSLAAALACGPHLGSLQHLSLHGNTLRCHGVACLCHALHASAHMTALTALDLSHNDMAQHGAAAVWYMLAHAQHLKALQRIELDGNKLGGEGVDPTMWSMGLVAALTTGYRGAAAAPPGTQCGGHLRSLKRLSLRACDVEKEHVQQMREQLAAAGLTVEVLGQW